MIKDKFKIRGDVSIKLYDEATGLVKETREIRNLVVDAGLALLMLRLAGNTQAAVSHMAIGSGAVAAVPGNVALGAQLARVTLGVANAVNNTLTCTGSFPAGTGTGNVQEAGIFNDPVAGAMLCRTAFPLITKQAADGMSITWVLTITAA